MLHSAGSLGMSTVKVAVQGTPGCMVDPTVTTEASGLVHDSGSMGPPGNGACSPMATTVACSCSGVGEHGCAGDRAPDGVEVRRHRLRTGLGGFRPCLWCLSLGGCGHEGQPRQCDECRQYGKDMPLLLGVQGCSLLREGVADPPPPAREASSQHTQHRVWC